jgi:flagellar biosynthesis/type III secretory pathway protein FliH
MSSKLHRGDGVPTEPIRWRLACPSGTFPVESQDYLPAAYSVTPGSEPVDPPRPRGLEEHLRAAYQDGFEAGQAAGRKELADQLEAMRARLARSIEELSGLRPRFRLEAEEDVVALAIAIARRILHRELTVAPEALLGLVKAALEKMEIREVHRVRVSKDDAPMVQQFFENLGLPRRVEVLADPSLEHGAAILESNHGILDASVETQLAEIERGFADLVRRA